MHMQGDLGTGTRASASCFSWRPGSGSARFTSAICAIAKGFHLAAQAADPLPDAADAPAPFRIAHLKYGAAPGGGRIGFRRMAPLAGEYANLIARTV
jgi:hypothetical protein